MDSESYRALMRHQAGAVSVIAVGPPGQRTGLTATAVCSLSDDPPMILACVNRRSQAHEAIRSARAFSVNLLASDQQELALRFSGRQRAQGEARFPTAEWGTLATGAPVLNTALASLDCVLIDEHAFTTHSVFIGQVVDGRFRAEAAPLLYLRGDYWDLSGLGGKRIPAARTPSGPRPGRLSRFLSSWSARAARWLRGRR